MHLLKYYYLPCTTITGGTTLTPGQSYVVFLTTSGLAGGAANPSSYWGITSHFSDGYSGGTFVYSNNFEDFDALTAKPSDGNPNTLDAAFEMNFCSAAFPEPGAFAMLVGTGVIVAGILTRRKKST